MNKLLKEIREIIFATLKKASVVIIKLKKEQINVFSSSGWIHLMGDMY